MATRTYLKETLFKNGACPDAKAYAELFDSMLNLDDDGIDSPKDDNPLHIKAPDKSKTALKIRGSLELQSHKNQRPYISSINEKGLRIAAEVDAGGRNIGPSILLLPQNYTDPDQRGRMYLLFGDETKDEIPGSAIISFQARYKSGHKELLQLNKNNVLLVPNGGKVGIGTRDPAANLEIKSSAKYGELIRFGGWGDKPWFFSQGYSEETGAILNLKPLYGDMQFNIASGDGSTIAHFRSVGEDNPTEIHLVPNGGKVGIGTKPKSSIYTSGADLHVEKGVDIGFFGDIDNDIRPKISINPETEEIYVVITKVGHPESDPMSLQLIRAVLHCRKDIEMLQQELSSLKSKLEN